MIATLTLVLAATVIDPRPALVEMQLDGRTRDALVRVDKELAERPEASRRLGFDFLRGHLLDQLDNAAAGEAFAAAMISSPELGAYSRYRLALEQERSAHPEVAAGLVASVVDARPPALLPEAVQLLSRTLARGGDCRLLNGLRLEELPATQRRILQLSQADCALRAGSRELGRSLLVALLEENRQDDTGRAAAERLAVLLPDNEAGRLPWLLGLTFHQHREFERAIRLLRRALEPGEGLSDKDKDEALYAHGRSHFWQERYTTAAVVFGGLAHGGNRPEERARALYQQGRSYELLGQWKLAAESFRRSYLAEPTGEFSAAALFSIVRLEWRSGNEPAATPLYQLLVSRQATRREWRDHAFRASLFLASSDIVRGRRNRAKAWLDQAVPADADERLELAYWRGRQAELDRDTPAVLAAYLEALRIDLYHPLAQSARARLAEEPLAKPAAAEARRLVASERFADLYDAWLLLGNRTDVGKSAWWKAREALLRDPLAGDFVRLTEVPVERWPIWKEGLLRSERRPEEMLLALGVFPEGAPAVRQHFPVSDPSLAFTGCRLLSKSGEHERAILHAETLRLRASGRVPLIFLLRDFHNLLYPNAWWEILTGQSRLRGAPQALVAAVIREESRFDRFALSPAAARGLTQFTLPTARRIGGQIGLARVEPEDLYRPEIAIALGATYLAQLLKEFDGAAHMAIAGYNAGEPQAELWRSYCFSPEVEEYFTKVNFKETRGYLRKVLTSRTHYEELYP